MQPKYSNIFWHEGVKIFEENLLKTEKGRIRIDHLENDVTKALLNLFEHCNRKVLGAFLRIIGAKGSPDAFEMDFQVTDTVKFRQKKNKIMLSIVSTSTPSKSDANYARNITRPDACIFSENTAILIEAKTQSPLIEEQIESHIKEFLGSDTTIRRITWEDISENFINLQKKLGEKDRFLISQFCALLELIGISEFNGFSASDFEMLGSVGRIPDEDFLDFKRALHRKIGKFITMLTVEIKPSFSFKNFETYVPGVSLSRTTWCGFYFFDDDSNIGVNVYPNLNFVFSEYGIEISVNAEIKSSINQIIRCMKKTPEEFDSIVTSIKDFTFSIYYRMQFRPRVLIWNLVPGYPLNVEDFRSKNILSSIQNFGKEWRHFRNTLLFQMKIGERKHYSGRFFSDSELEFAKKRNPRPSFALRFDKRSSAKDIEKMGKKIIPSFKKEALKLKKLLEFVNT
jgi:hypothetical protein